MSLKNSIEKLKAAMRSQTGQPKNACPPNTACYTEVDNNCMKNETLYTMGSGGFCKENRSSVRVGSAPCPSMYTPKCG
jgi:hypothetical protein